MFFVCKVVGDNLFEYIKFEMKDIIVIIVLMGGFGDDDWIIENVILNFGEYKYVYIEQKLDGFKGVVLEFVWDIVVNEKK